MSVKEMQEEVIQLIRQEENEHILQQLAKILKQDKSMVHEEDTYYLSDMGQNQVEEAEAAINSGHFFTLDEVKEEMDQWFKHHASKK